MKRCSKCGETKRFELFSLKSSAKDGRCHWCKACSAAAASAYYKANKATVRAKLRTPEARARKSAHDRAYRDRNRESLSARKAAKYRAQAESARAARRADYAKSADRYKSRAAEWKRANRAKHNAGCMMRHARKLEATPIWLDDDQKWMIEEAYILAKLRGEMTGVEWHVDHIVPLRSPVVCGLHVPWNLAVITARENCSKRNRLDIGDARGS